MLLTYDHVLIGNTQGHLKLIEQDTARTIRQINHGITCIVYCPELSRVITGSEGRKVRVWNVTTGECVKVLYEQTSHVRCAAVHGTTYVNSEIAHN
jgi:WD40 repeat protein